MKIVSLSVLVLTSLLSLTSAFAEGRSVPVDLQDMKTRWMSTAKTSLAEQLIGMDFISFTDDDEDMFHRVMQDLSLRGGGEAKGIRSFEMVPLNDDSRDHFLKRLFPAREQDLKFCGSFPAPKLTKQSSAKELTEEEKSEKTTKKIYTHCRNNMRNMLGGILHTDPLIVIVDVTYKDGDSELLAYVRSALEEKQFIRYSFQR